MNKTKKNIKEIFGTKTYKLLKEFLEKENIWDLYLSNYVVKDTKKFKNRHSKDAILNAFVWDDFSKWFDINKKWYMYIANSLNK